MEPSVLFHQCLLNGVTWKLSRTDYVPLWVPFDCSHVVKIQLCFIGNTRNCKYNLNYFRAGVFNHWSKCLLLLCCGEKFILYASNWTWNYVWKSKWEPWYRTLRNTQDFTVKRFRWSGNTLQGVDIWAEIWNDRTKAALLEFKIEYSWQRDSKGKCPRARMS